MEFPVKCVNMERGCQWVETVGMLEEHVGGCEFTLVPCQKVRFIRLRPEPKSRLADT